MAKEVINSSGTVYNSLTFGSIITGNITSESDFRIDGEVQGDINCKGKVVIGHSGVLKGNIACESAEIIGHVVGNIIVTECITLRASAVFTGDIQTQTLVVEPNAIFNGNCSMKKNHGETKV
jgi:cytoskeletal protein CcmA (bactofilin family)